MLKLSATVDQKGLKEASREGVIPFILTTKSVDRDSEVVLPLGANTDSFKQNPVFVWVHDIRNKPPIGKLLTDTFVITEDYFKSDVEFDLNDPFAKMIYNKYKNGFLNAGSIRFTPTKLADPIFPNQKGATIAEWELLEFSAVPVPANPNALMVKEKALQSQEEALEIEKALFGEVSKYLKAEDWLKEMKQIPYGVKIEYIKGLDISNQVIAPANLAFDWAAKFCECEVKELFVTSTSFNKLWKGSFLNAFDSLSKNWNKIDTRRFNSYDKELPPIHEAIQLNSKEAGVYLVDGSLFMEVPDKNIKVIFEFSKGWYNVVTVYISNKYKNFASDFIDTVWKYAKDNHKLKGEKFSLSGNFLDINPNQNWDKVFLPRENETILKRMVNQFNEKRMSYPNRGIILMGPPGTGKTLSGRTIMNQIKEDTTFIWVSAKDFYNFGTSNGLINSFETAKLLAPSVLLFEDADNWIGGGMALDLIKSEMDGISQSKGLVTIIATNYPERLPDSLIDRPGRFHDVLEFNLPGKEERSRMLTSWIQNLDEQVLLKFTDETEGFSGAHIYEFVEFSKLLKSESELTIQEAMENALAKIKEQRKLIGTNQLAGNTYRDRKVMHEKEIPFIIAAKHMQLLLENDEKFLDGLRKEYYIELCDSYNKEGKSAPEYRKGNYKTLDSPEELSGKDQSLIIAAATLLAEEMIANQRAD